MKNFFNIDFHVAVIGDLRKIFSDLGHTVDDRSMSGHSWVLNRQRVSVPMLEGDNWYKIIENKLWENFYNTYKDELNKYDAFVCCYPPCFSMLYKNFDKPIIIQIPIRYEHPFSNSPLNWTFFNEYIKEGVKSGKIILISNSIYDKKYIEHFVNIECNHIPNLCEYTNINYNFNGQENYIYSTKCHINGLNNNIVRKDSVLGSGYKFSDLLNFKGIVHFPYQVSVMSLFEQYTANIPLFFPSHNFMLELYKSIGVLSEVSWNNLFKYPSKSVINSIKNEPDPNNYNDVNCVNYWLKFADYYDKEWMPYINQFNSIEELNSIINSVDVQKISDNMKENNRSRKNRIYKMWQDVIGKIK